MSVDEGLRLRVTSSTDQPASVDERLTALGDGLKYFLMQFHYEGGGWAAMNREVSPDDVIRVSTEISNAIDYHCVSDYYNECRSNSFELFSTERGAVIAPIDSTLELARVVTNYRRTMIENRGASLFLRQWRMASQEKRAVLCDFVPVAGVSLRGDFIDHIELSCNDECLERSGVAIYGKLQFVMGPDREFLLESLPKFGGIKLIELLRAWQFAQSLSQAIFEQVDCAGDGSVKSIMAAGATVSRAVLLASLAESLGIEEVEASPLLGALTFDPARAHQLWTQPFVRSGDQYCLVLTCVRSVAMRRVLERWMNDGGFD